MIHHISNDRRLREWLAAYADGELDAAARLRVERWLADCPDALAELQDQESLSPVNAGYWQAVEPPAPSENAWQESLAAVLVGTARTTAVASGSRRLSRHLAWGVTITGLAAAVMVLVTIFGRSSPDRPSAIAVQETVANVENEEEDHIYRVAKASEVELLQLPEESARLVVVGRHPMSDVPFLLALAGEVQVLNYGPDDQGILPDIDSTWGPDASMLWAPSNKR